MVKEEIGRGATVEEAKEDARLKLGISEETEFDFEIIALPKKKIMGIFGGSDAEVKAWITVPDKKSAQKLPKRKEKEIKKETKKEQPKEAGKQSKAMFAAEDAVDYKDLPAESRAAKATAYLSNILKCLGIEDVSMKVCEFADGAAVFLEGEGLGIIIGRRGETLDALQHLVSLSARNNQGYYKVTLNIGDYRERREDTLSSLAKRVSEQVLSSGKGRALEPMNPYERRIIHTTVQEIEGVTSASVGEGEGRRVVIVPEGQDVKSVRIDRRRNDRRGGGRERNDRRGSRRPQNSNTVATTPTREPKSDSDIPLYGKIK